mgnify:CR=1 FL=1
MKYTSVTPATGPVREAITLARRAILRQALREGLLWAALGALVSIGVMALLLGPADGPLLPRWLAWLVTAISFAVGLFTRLIVERSRYAEDERVAARMEAVRPALRTDVRAVLDFMRREPVAATPQHQALRAHLHARLARELKAGDPDWEDVPERRDLSEPLALLCGVAIIIALFAAASPSHVGAGLRQFWIGDTPAEDDERGGSRLPQRPLLTNIEVVVIPPAYTGLQERRLVGAGGDVIAPIGSEVRLRATSLEPVRDATLVLTMDGEPSRVAIDVANQTTLQISFTVLGSGSWNAELTTGGGERVRDVRTRSITARPDTPPRVTIREPAGNLEVTPGEIVDIDYNVADDYGIGEVNLAWHFAGREQDVQYLPLLGRMDTTSADDVAPFDTAPLVLQPGDEVIVVIEARDTNVDTGPGIGRSRPISLSVASPFALSEQLLVAKEELFEAALLQLGAMLEHDLNDYTSRDDELVAVPAPFATPALYAEAVLHQDEVAQRWPELISRFQQLAELMATDEATPPRELTLLDGAVQALSRQQRATMAALEPVVVTIRSDAEPDERSITRLAAQHAAHTADAERVTLLLEDLIAAQKADRVARSLEELANIRERLRDLLEQYRETQDPDLRDRIQREMDRLALRMRELLDQLSDQIQNLPQEHLNREALEASDAMQGAQTMSDALQQMRELLDQGDIDGALRSLEELSGALDDMMREFGDPLANADPGALSEFDAEMAQLMDRIGDIEAREQELVRETAELEERWRREREEQVRGELERRLDRVREQVRAELDRFAALDRDAIAPMTAERLAEAEAAMQALERRLEASDIVASEEAANRAIADLGNAQSMLERAQRFSEGNQRAERQVRDASRTTQGARRSMDDVARSLRELQELAQPRVGDAQRAQLRQLGERQGEIASQLEQLQQQMGTLGERFPMMQGRFDEPLQQAGQGMQSSRDGLQQGSPGGARPGQQQALDGLRSLRQELQQSMARRRERQERESGGRTREERVEIPEDAAAGRAGYRRQVMDAMREGGLEGYDDVIRRYYESLMQ